ncbi:MAG TPA: nucleoside permease, partial [Pseudomonadales bacterium]|nr:nucleoside permease [Pseudomonadales bacterium]
DIGMAYGTQSWGAIIAPFIIGLIADRFFNAERILGVLHLMGAALMYMLFTANDVSSFYPYLLGYMLCYMPTLALVNSVSFNQLKDPASEFGKIRLWGTIGWIVAGLVISYVFSWDSQDSIANGMLRNTFAMTALVSLVLGIYSFTLPATPPAAKGQAVSLRDILGLDAIALLKDRNFLMFFVASVLICIPLAFYYSYANPFLTDIGVENATGKMTIGQVSEVLFMLLLPVFLKRFGIKATLLVGMLAWVIRYISFAFGDPNNSMLLLLMGIALHGICYDFFFVSGQIYTDHKAGDNVKSAAQGLITLATYGVGMLIGFAAAGHIVDAYTAIGSSPDWQTIWLIPAGFAAAVFVVYAMVFKNETLGDTK